MSDVNIDFGGALAALRLGKRVRRAGWNGQGMYLYLVSANRYPPSTEIAKKEFGEMVPYQAYIAIKTVQRTCVPWVATQTDLLELDWEVLD